MWYDFKSVVLRVNRFIRIHFQVQYTCVKMLWDKYYENIVLDMNEIEDTSILPVLPQDDIERLDEADKEEKTKKKETGKDTKSEK